jgi:hemerythrin-like metal-binding protein
MNAVFMLEEGHEVRTVKRTVGIDNKKEKEPMELFAWSEKYSVNVRQIDEQHKKLIGLVAQLNNAMRQGKGKDVLGKVLDELAKYTITHFRDEERIMQSAGYPDLEAHKSKHQWMNERVAQIYRDYQDGKVTLSIEVMNFLQSWVDKHILETDKHYAPFLKSKGIS